MCYRTTIARDRQELGAAVRMLLRLSLLSLPPRLRRIGAPIPSMMRPAPSRRRAASESVTGPA